MARRSSAKDRRYVSIQVVAQRASVRSNPRTIDLLIFFFNDTATTEIYPLSLHDALPISTSANEVAGAQSRAAGLVACAVVGLAVWLLLPWIERTPAPLLAAIVIHAVGHTLNPAALRPYFAWRRDRLIVGLAFFAVLALGLLDGLLLAKIGRASCRGKSVDLGG